MMNALHNKDTITPATKLVRKNHFKAFRLRFFEFKLSNTLSFLVHCCVARLQDGVEHLPLCRKTCFVVRPFTRRLSSSDLLDVVSHLLKVVLGSEECAGGLSVLPLQVQKNLPWTDDPERTPPARFGTALEEGLERTPTADTDTI